MKQCPGCNRTCYDTELFCPDCGRAMPSTIHCTYCGSVITDVTALNCPSCQGQLIIDRYPAHKGTIHCSACGKPRPVTSKYCTACGIATEAAPKPITSGMSVEISATDLVKKKQKRAIIILSICLGVFVGLPILLAILSEIVNSCYYYSTEVGTSSHTYSYDYDTSTALVDNTVIPESSFKKITLDDLSSTLSNISVGDYIEVTGAISSRYYSRVELIPENLTTDNHDNEVEIFWGYSSDDSIEGNYIDSYCIVGDKITIRAKVTSVYESLSLIDADGISIVAINDIPYTGKSTE